MTGFIAPLHYIPRFGHSRTFADFFSLNPAVRDGYKGGIVSFWVFLLSFLMLWVFILLQFKFYFGVDQVGCAAGGRPLNIDKLRKAGLRRRERRRYIIRSWRLQNVFLIAACLLTASSYMLLNQGMGPFFRDGLGEIHLINDRVESMAFQGFQIANSLHALRPELESINNRLYNDILDASICRSKNSKVQIQKLARLQVAFEANMVNTNSVLLSINMKDLASKLSQVTDIAKVVDGYIENYEKSGWMFTIFLIILNSINAFLIIGALLSKMRITCNPFRAALSFILVPAFCLTTLAAICITVGTASAGILHADICSGGDPPGSPLGTIEDILLRMGFTERSLSYQSLIYYATNCSANHNPLDIINEYQIQSQNTADTVRLVVETLEDNVVASSIANECGIDYQQHAYETLYQLESLVQSTLGHMQSISNMTECSNIARILDPLLEGATCTTAVQGSTWLFCSLLAISILALIMLSTRAALFNVIILPQHKNRREKEFEEYKNFMSGFYDVSRWQLSSVKGGKLKHERDEPTKGYNHHHGLKPSHSTDTGSTASMSPTVCSKRNFGELGSSSTTNDDYQEKDEDEYSYQSSSSERDSASAITSPSYIVGNLSTRLHKQQQRSRTVDSDLTENFQDEGGDECSYQSSSSEEDSSSAGHQNSVITSLSHIAGNISTRLRKKHQHQQRSQSDAVLPTVGSDLSTGADMTMSNNMFPPFVHSPHAFKTPRRRRPTVVPGTADIVHIASYKKCESGISMGLQRHESKDCKLTSSVSYPLAPQKRIKNLGRTNCASKMKK